ncbi:MAG: hypothetical protein ABI604_16595 [Nitrospirota bacterium]
MSAQTTIIPSLSVSERYDSNIFSAPKSLLSPGIEPEDFITTVTPQLNIAHAGSLIRGRIFGSGLVTKYINNPERDFTGYNVGGQLDLLDAARQVSPRITSLTVRGTYRSVPSTNGFGATGGGLGTGFGSPSTGVLETGQVTNRASRQIYTLGVTGAYQLTGVTTLNAGFNYSKISFGEQGAQSGGVNNQLFDTTGYQGMTTISTRISARDTVGATAIMSQFVQEDSSGSSGQGSFTTITETLNWSRLWTQQLSTSLRGGGIFKLPVGSDIPGQSVKSQFVPTVGALMTYTSLSGELRDVGAFEGLPSLAGSLSPGGIMAPGAYTATMSYRFSLLPSYAFGAGPLKVHVLGINAIGGITTKLSGRVGLNYSHGSSSTPTSTFDTVGLTVGTHYLLGPVLASLTYNWLYYSREDDQSLSTQSQYEFSKKIVMLSFSYAFTSPSFFREGISFPSGAGSGSSPSGDGSGILRKEE